MPKIELNDTKILITNKEKEATKYYIKLYNNK